MRRQMLLWLMERYKNLNIRITCYYLYCRLQVCFAWRHQCSDLMVSRPVPTRCDCLIVPFMLAQMKFCHHLTLYSLDFMYCTCHGTQVAFHPTIIGNYNNEYNRNSKNIKHGRCKTCIRQKPRHADVPLWGRGHKPSPWPTRESSQVPPWKRRRVRRSD